MGLCQEEEEGEEEDEGQDLLSDRIRSLSTAGGSDEEGRRRHCSLGWVYYCTTKEEERDLICYGDFSEMTVERTLLGWEKAC